MNEKGINIPLTYQFHEAKAVTVQPTKNPNQQPINLVLGEGAAAAAIGVTIGLVAAKLIMYKRTNLSFIRLKRPEIEE